MSGPSRDGMVALPVAQRWVEFTDADGTLTYVDANSVVAIEIPANRNRQPFSRLLLVGGHTISVLGAATAVRDKLEAAR